MLLEAVPLQPKQIMTGNMLTTELLWNEDAFRQLEPVWDDLARGSMTDTPFQTWAYQKAWWRHLSPGDLMTICVRDESGEIVGLAPFFQQRR